MFVSIAILVGLLLAVVAWRRGSHLDRSIRGLAAAVSFSATVAMTLVVSTALEAPYSPWDMVRIAPAMVMLRGQAIYAGATSGPTLSTMYGPIAAIAYIPAALLGDDSLASIAGRAISFFYVAAPLVGVCLLRRDDRIWRGSIVVIGLFMLLVLPSLRYSSTYLHADAPALGLAGLAGLLVARRRGAGWDAVVVCSLAVATKQTMIALPPALILAVALIDGRRAAIGFSVRLAVVGLLLGSICVLVGGEELWLNVVRIPGGVPWKGRIPGNLIATGLELLLHAAPILLAGVIAILCPRSIEPDANRLPITYLSIALFLTPMAILGRVKQAGDVNSFSPALYPLLLAVAASACSLRIRPVAVPRLVSVLVLMLAVFGLIRVRDEGRIRSKLRPMGTESSYLRRHPGEVFFPWNPAAHVSAEGRATHHLFSAWERGVAGFPVSREHLLSGLPEQARYVAFPLKRLGPVAGSGSSFEMLQAHGLLDPNPTPTRLADLPDYECYRIRR